MLFLEFVFPQQLHKQILYSKYQASLHLRSFLNDSILYSILCLSFAAMEVSSVVAQVQFTSERFPHRNLSLSASTIWTNAFFMAKRYMSDYPGGLKEQGSAPCESGVVFSAEGLNVHLQFQRLCWFLPYKLYYINILYGSWVGDRILLLKCVAEQCVVCSRDALILVCQ